MLHAAMRQLFAAPAPADVAPEPGNLVVVITGLSLVFLILLLLIGIILIQGRVFGRLDKRKAQQTTLHLATPTGPAPAAAMFPAPAVQAGIAPEVVAAITAAIHVQTGGAGRLRSVALAKPGGAGNAWRLAGVLQTTEPF